MDTHNTRVRFGPAPPGSTPFCKQDGRVIFEPQNYRRMDYGHSFDPNRGYRVYFCFSDTPYFANTWEPKDLLRWCDDCSNPDENAEMKSLFAICRQQARQCVVLNREWKRRGRPQTGINMNTKGSA